MLPGDGIGYVAMDLLLEPPLRRRQVAVDFNVKEILPSLRGLVPRLSQQKLTAGIRLNADLFRQLHIDSPLEFPFRQHPGQFYPRNSLREDPGGNQDVSDSYGVLEKIGIVPLSFSSDGRSRLLADTPSDAA